MVTQESVRDPHDLLFIDLSIQAKPLKVGQWWGVPKRTSRTQNRLGLYGRQELRGNGKSDEAVWLDVQVGSAFFGRVSDVLTNGYVSQSRGWEYPLGSVIVGLSLPRTCVVSGVI